jgi:hypothetical protein
MQADYKIIGGDGVEYGPATLEELKSWIRDGRVAGMTKVWRSDLAGGRLRRVMPSWAASWRACTPPRPAAAQPCGFWARLGAYVIDSVILGAIFHLVWSQLAESQHWPLPALPTEWTETRPSNNSCRIGRRGPTMRCRFIIRSFSSTMS